MRITVLIFAVLLHVVTSNIALAEEAAPTSESESRVYTVQKGDTLWDISGKHLADPYKWPDIWNINNFIENPHYIYPGQKITIRFPDVKREPERIEPAPIASTKVEEPGEKAVEAIIPEPEPEPEPVSESQPKPGKIILRYPGLERISFMIPEDLHTAEATGIRIIDARDQRLMISKDDYVFVNVGERTGARAGQKFAIYNNSRAVSHPVTKKPLGRIIDVIGIVRLERVNDKISEAKVVASYDAISRGDKIAEYEPVPADLEIKSGIDSLEGIVIANARGSQEMAEQDIVFLDKGSLAGVEAGNIFRISLPGRVTEGYDIPSEDIGRLVILSTRKEFSTALVMKTTKSFHVGTLVRIENRR